MVYRINRMHYKALIHLLCNETALYAAESLLSLCLGEMQSCLAQVLV